MIIAFGKDRLRLKLAALEAEIEQTKLNIKMLDPVPRAFTTGLVKRQGKAARIRKALELKGGAA